MIADIEFYLSENMGDLLPRLTMYDSPLRLDKKVEEGSYMIRSKNPILDNFFMYFAPDSEEINEVELHIQAQNDWDLKLDLSYIMESVI